jgi:hypothetical protein
VFTLLRPEFAFLEMQDAENVGMIDTLEKPELPRRHPNLRNCADRSARDFDHGLDLSHLIVWPPQPTTIAGIGLIALAIFSPNSRFLPSYGACCDHRRWQNSS